MVKKKIRKLVPQFLFIEMFTSLFSFLFVGNNSSDELFKLIEIFTNYWNGHSLTL